VTGTVTTVVFMISLYFGLALLILWVRDRVSSARHQKRNPPEKVAAERAAYEERILRPDWTFTSATLSDRRQQHCVTFTPTGLSSLLRVSSIPISSTSLRSTRSTSRACSMPVRGSDSMRFPSRRANLATRFT